MLSSGLWVIAEPWFFSSSTILMKIFLCALDYCLVAWPNFSQDLIVRQMASCLTTDQRIPGRQSSAWLTQWPQGSQVFSSAPANQLNLLVWGVCTDTGLGFPQHVALCFLSCGFIWLHSCIPAVYCGLFIFWKVWQAFQTSHAYAIFF